MIRRRQIRLRSGSVNWLGQLGLGALAFGSCLRLYLGILAGKARLDLPAFADALRQVGLSMLSAITLVTATVGLILGIQTASVLNHLDLPGLVLPSISYAIVAELVPILVGILVAGRAGVALAVRQATLVVTGEIDGLLVNGVDPVQFTLGPTLLAILVMSFALAVWGMLVTTAGALLWLWSTAGVPPSLFLDAFRQTLTAGILAKALLKPIAFGIVIAVVATVNGTLAGKDPAGIGQAATRTMIGAVAAILLIDLIFVLTR